MHAIVAISSKARMSFAPSAGGLPADRALVASQVVGLVMVRYVVRLEPLASADPEEVVRLVAPNVQRYLTGDLSQGRLLDQCGS
jgi:hypothetical protein